MNPALVVTLLRQRLSSPLRVVILAAQFLLPVAMSLVTHALDPIGEAGFWFAFTFAAGAIGQDVASGTLQLVLARPVTRPEYVVSRWFAAGLAGTLLAFAQVAIAVAWMALGHAAPAAGEVAVLAAGNALLAFGGAAVIVCLSACLDGLGDVAAWFLGAIALALTGNLAEYKHWPVLARAVTELQGVLEPRVDLAWLFRGGGPSWFELASYASTVTLCLALAIARLNRRELSYAAG